MRSSCQLGEGDRTHRDHFWKGSSNRRIVPVDDNRGVEESRCHLQVLVHDPIEIRPESLSIDPRPVGRRHKELSRRHERPTRLLDRTEFRHGHAIAGDDEALASGNGLYHFGIVVSELALCDGPDHETIVAKRATFCYEILRGLRLIEHPGHPVVDLATVPWGHDHDQEHVIGTDRRPERRKVAFAVVSCGGLGRPLKVSGSYCVTQGPLGGPGQAVADQALRTPGMCTARHAAREAVRETGPVRHLTSPAGCTSIPWAARRRPPSARPD